MVLNEGGLLRSIASHLPTVFRFIMKHRPMSYPSGARTIPLRTT